MAKETWLRIDNLQCNARKCEGNKKGFSLLPPENPAEEFPTPEVYCGCCGGRVGAEFQQPE